MDLRKQSSITDFPKKEPAGEIVLMSTALLVIIIVNTPAQNTYALLIEIPVEIRIGTLEIAKPTLLWINDGLMAIFFFLVRLELKREMGEGELSDFRSIFLPGVVRWEVC